MERKEKNLNQLSETSDPEVKVVNGERDSAKISSGSINMPEVTLFPSEFEDQEIENDIMLEVRLRYSYICRPTFVNWSVMNT